jgi:nitrous oxidase accessory protein NosD
VTQRRRVRPLTAVAAAVFTASIALGVSPAAATTTLVVDDDGAAALGNCAAETPAHATIQEAVDAAVPDDIIQVCPGTYAESVTVPPTTTRLRILGPQAGVDARQRDVGIENEATVDPPAGGQGFSLLASNTVLDGFTIQGADAAPGIYTSPLSTRYKIDNNIVRDNVFGLYLNSAGVDNTLVRFNRFEDNDLPGSASGNGIYSDQGADDLLVRGNAFSGHTNASILFAYVEGVTNDHILLESNRSMDDASFADFFSASNVRIVRNRTADTQPAGDDLQGSAIRIGGQTSDVLIQDNRLSNPAFSGIAIRDDAIGAGVANVQVFGNRVDGAKASGLDISSPVLSVVQALDNTFANNGVDGISMSAGTRGNLLRGNRSVGNGAFDCHDESIGRRTAGTANRWRADHGVTDQPDGICS